MNPILDLYNYSSPTISEFYDKERNFQVLYSDDKTEASLFLGNEKWITYDFEYETNVWETFSHYWIANGCCICTGLGFAARESWILTKRNVSKVIVLEKSQEVIEYHRITNPKIFKELEILNVDANTYRGKCDTLLLDHYEDENYEEIIRQSSAILNNIECEEMWFWFLEWYIHEIYLRENKKYPIIDIYYWLKDEYNLHKLPNLSEVELKLFYTTALRGLKNSLTDKEYKDISEMKKDRSYRSLKK